MLSSKERDHTPILNVDVLQITKCSLSGKVGEERTEGGGVGAEADPDTALTGVHLMKGAFHLKFYRSMRFGVKLLLLSSLVTRFTFLIIGNTGARNWSTLTLPRPALKLILPNSLQFYCPLQPKAQSGP